MSVDDRYVVLDTRKVRERMKKLHLAPHLAEELGRKIHDSLDAKTWGKMWSETSPTYRLLVGHVPGVEAVLECAIDTLCVSAKEAATRPTGTERTPTTDDTVQPAGSLNLRREQRQQILTAFAAGPVTHPRELVGRGTELTKINDTIDEPTRHLLLLGPRGAGKSSLIRSAQTDLADVARWVYVSCDAHLNTFGLICQKVLSTLEIPRDDGVGPNEVTEALRSIDRSTVVVVDELDTLDERSDATAQVGDFAHLCKQLGDQRLDRVTWILIGVEGTATEVLRAHQSSIRNLNVVELAGFSSNQVQEFFAKKTEHTGLSFSRSFVERLDHASNGLPSFLQTVGRLACLQSIEENCDEIVPDHVTSQLDLLLDELAHSLSKAHLDAIHSTREVEERARLLYACAAAADRERRFAISDAALAMAALTGEGDPERLRGLLDQLIGEKVPLIGRHYGAGDRSFRFADGRDIPYILLHGWNDWEFKLFDDRCRYCERRLSHARPSEKREHEKTCHLRPDEGGG